MQQCSSLWIRIGNFEKERNEKKKTESNKKWFSFPIEILNPNPEQSSSNHKTIKRWMSSMISKWNGLITGTHTIAWKWIYIIRMYCITTSFFEREKKLQQSKLTEIMKCAITCNNTHTLCSALCIIIIFIIIHFHRLFFFCSNVVSSTKYVLPFILEQMD